MIAGVERDLLDVLVAQGLDHGVTGHVKGGLVGVRQPLAVLTDALDAQFAGVHPVGADLSADIGAVVGHALEEVLQHAEVLLPLVEAVGVVGHVQHPAVDADTLRCDPQQVTGGGVEVVRRAGQPDLVREQLHRWVLPLGGFGVVGHQTAPSIRKQTRGLEPVAGRGVKQKLTG